ncbi:MAG: TolC family protein [Bacteroidales bacterium]|nr:TolC family protein [Bacteroidales bacterium]
MKNCRICIVFIAGLLISFSNFGFGQSQDQKVDARIRSVEKNNSTFLEVDNSLIPPLHMLIDSALTYSPLLKTKDIEKSIREWELKTAKIQWTDYFETFVEYRYGSVDYVVLSPTGTSIQNDISVTSRYHAGARINLTIFDLLNHRRNVAMARERVDLEDARAEEIKQLIRQEVIRLWGKLRTYKEIVGIKADHLQAQRININEARMRYEAGEVPIVEYARVKQIVSKANEEFVLAQQEYREALYLLSELVGRNDLSNWVNPRL